MYSERSSPAGNLRSFVVLEKYLIRPRRQFGHGDGIKCFVMVRGEIVPCGEAALLRCIGKASDTSRIDRIRCVALARREIPLHEVALLDQILG